MVEDYWNIFWRLLKRVAEDEQTDQMPLKSCHYRNVQTSHATSDPRPANLSDTTNNQDVKLSATSDMKRYVVALDGRGTYMTIFLYSPRKHMLWVLIRSASVRCF